jgi:hypothetical protein
MVSLRSVAFGWGLALLLISRVACQLPQNGPAQAVNAAVVRAQAIIDSMPFPAERASVQAALDNFKKMNAAGKVSVSESPGGGDRGDAFTYREWSLPGPPASGSGPEVGAGGERIELGVDLVDPQITSDLVLAGVLLHEGLRCAQTIIVIGSSGDWICQFWLNEYTAYRMQVRFLQAAIALGIAGGASEVQINDMANMRRSRQRRADNELAKYGEFDCWT